MNQLMKTSIFVVFVFSLFLTACGGRSSSKKQSLDQITYKYAATIRWSNFEAAVNYLKPGIDEIKPTSFQLNRLKQFKVSSYTASPIRAGSKENIILQDVEIELYNIHTNSTKTIHDSQSWEFDPKSKLWFLTSGLPKL